MARSIPETAAVIIGFLSVGRRIMLCKSGERIGMVVATKEMATEETLSSNSRQMEAILGERNRGIKETRVSGMFTNVRDFRFGSKGLLGARDCSIKRPSKGEEE